MTDAILDADILLVDDEPANLRVLERFLGRAGFRRVRATLQPDNEPSRRLVTRAGVRLAVSGGLLEGEGDLRLLDPPRVDRHAVVALAARQPGIDRKSLG